MPLSRTPSFVFQMLIKVFEAFIVDQRSVERICIDPSCKKRLLLSLVISMGSRTRRTERKESRLKHTEPPLRRQVSHSESLPPAPRQSPDIRNVGEGRFLCMSDHGKKSLSTDTRAPVHTPPVQEEGKKSKRKRLQSVRVGCGFCPFSITRCLI